MIEISTLPQSTVDGIAADLAGLRETLRTTAPATTSPSAAAARTPSIAGRNAASAPANASTIDLPALRLSGQAIHRFRPAHPRRLHLGRRRHLADPGARRLCPGLHRALRRVALCRWRRHLLSSRPGSTPSRPFRSAASARRSPTGPNSSEHFAFCRPAASPAASRICTGMSGPNPNSARSKSASAIRR
jgi:hypothetical protein